MSYVPAHYFSEMFLLWGAVAVVGGLVAAYALLAWRRQRSVPMLALGAGLLLLSVGPAIEWFGVYWMTDNIYNASMGCAVLMLGGFGLVLFSARTRIP